MAGLHPNYSSCETPDQLVEIFPCDISSATDTTKTFCYEVNQEDFRIPYDSLEVFRSIQKYLLRILEDLINYIQASSKEWHISHVSGSLGHGSVKQVEIALCHYDRVMEAGSFQELLAYSDLFRRCIVSCCLPSNINDHNLIRLYLEKLEQLLESKPDFVNFGNHFPYELDESIKGSQDVIYSKAVEFDGSNDATKQNFFNSYENRKFGDQDFTLLLYTAHWETSDRKKKFLCIMEMIRKIAPGWAEKKNSYHYHCMKIMNISDFRSIDMQNYRAILVDLEENFVQWRDDDLLNTLTDLDYLRKLKNPDFTIRSREDLWKEIYQTNPKSNEEILIDDNSKYNNKITDYLSENVNYNNKKCIASPVHCHNKSLMKKQSRAKLAEKSSLSESYAMQAAKLPRVTGVFYGKSCFSWVAQIPVKKGHTKQLYFSVKKYGFKDARIKAIEAREAHTHCLGRDETALQIQPHSQYINNRHLSPKFESQIDFVNKSDSIPKINSSDCKPIEHYRSTQRGLRSQSFASQARASPQVPGVNYDSKRACWMVKGSSGSNTHKQFHIRKYGGFEAARSEAIQYLAKMNSPNATSSHNEKGIGFEYKTERTKIQDLRNCHASSHSIEQQYEDQLESPNSSTGSNECDIHYMKDMNSQDNLTTLDTKQPIILENGKYQDRDIQALKNLICEHESAEKEIGGCNDFTTHLYHTRLNNLSVV